MTRARLALLSIDYAKHWCRLGDLPQGEMAVLAFRPGGFVTLHQLITLAQEIGYRSGIGRALDGLGRALQATNPEQARAMFAKFRCIQGNG